VKKSSKIITVVIVLLIVFLGLGAAMKARSKKTDNSTIVQIEEVKRGELTELVSAPGEIEPRTKVEISAKVSARIIKLPYDEGDEVTCGDPNADPPVPASILVRLDSKDLETQLASATANYEAQSAQTQVEQARIASQRATLVGLDASLNQARRDMERQEGLLTSKDISQATFDQAQLKFDEFKSQYDSSKHQLSSSELNLVVLRHNLEAAQARIDQAKEALSHTVISSPIDGTVTVLNAEVGEMVMTGTMNNPGTVILEVADLSTMLLAAQVEEADVGKLAVGQKAKVFVQAFPDDEYEGVVDSIALKHRLSNTGTKVFRTEILLKGDVRKLYLGLTAHVDIQTLTHENVITVPSQAVMGRPVDDLPLEIRDNCKDVDKNKTFTPVVYRYIDGKAIVTPVKIGPSNLTHTVILSGITEGEKIIIGPYKVLEGLSHNKNVKDERAAESVKDANDTDVNAVDINETDVKTNEPAADTNNPAQPTDTSDNDKKN
jgi:HlyD family secretion protein